ncbi:MAG: TspO protein [Leifsonia sp.]|jgi:tryptophan-rich sensory protein|uniref:Tryptophan-rich sensory protein n=1 Tax=Microcella pacifica TaxID=2591847 RepID=A0A9E5JNZ0_9MICO|nr:TspO/MBR family protein [Microcella pacifica]MBR21450.1 TspO protein [Leifsonia sp.]MBU1251844.1 tryptophan-rich sensory protein [Actinomycetota bacterium]MBU1608575.1 tryptophan-rich sensory protein [Actinomycetota bacterium]MBU2315138.1 tryptophan-rich sensory protein [Actinomycetota bacterium]MBU2384951.1 tryptophan-rich sensory protein [Actinomycetota bacterium]
MVGARAQESAIPTSGDHSAVRSAFALTGFLAASFVVAVIGSALSVTAISGWYDDLAKPMWTPPNTVFGSVWTVLYSSMAVAAWLVWRHPASTARRRALVAYVVQLVLNGFWTPVFFGLGSLIGASGLWIALGIIVALDFAILAAIIRFADISKPAAALLIPYWFWTLFATTLNAAIAVLAA